MARRGLIAALLGLWLAAPAAAQPVSDSEAQTTPRWATEVTRELMSPFCPGVTVAECPSSQARSLEAWIVVQADSGRSKDEVLADLYDRYGDQVRAAPRAEGFGLAAYLVPIAVFVFGGIGVGLFLWRSTR